jgi:ABC-type multidrug transport system ATPase subunit
MTPLSADTVTDVMAETALLSVRGLSVSYGRTRAVNQLDLDIAPGETVALLGANGAG